MERTESAGAAGSSFPKKERTEGNRAEDQRSREAEQSASDREKGHGRDATAPWKFPWKGWRDVLWRTKNEIRNDNLSVVAGGVAFFFLLGVFPALAAAVSLFSLVGNPNALQNQLSSATLLPPQARHLMLQQLQSLRSSSGVAGLSVFLGIVFAVWSGSKGMKALIGALNIVYEERERRSIWRLNALALVFTAGGIVTALLAVGAILMAPSVLSHLGLANQFPALVLALRWPVLMVLFFLAMVLMYRFGPNRDAAQWKWLGTGAVLATALWIGGSALFSSYIAHFGTYNKMYGSLGAVVILLMWFYLTAYAILLGAELNSEMEHQTREDTTQGEPRPMGSRGARVADTLGEIP